MKIPLSPIDCLFLGRDAYPIEMSFRFPVRLEVDFIQAALDKLAQHWWPLRGSIEMRHNEAAIVPGTHALKILLEQSQHLPDEEELKAVGSLRNHLQTEPGQPLIQITVHNADNGSWLTASMAHALGDGYSYFLFLKNLSLVAAGEAPMDVKWDRSLLEPTDVVLESEATAATDDDFICDVGEPRSSSTSSLQWHLQQLTRDEAKTRVAQAQEIASSRIFLHDWLCAFHWQREARALALRGNAPTQVRLTTPVDFRRFRKNDLGSLFFGNAVFFASVVADMDEVVESPLGKLAEKIRYAIKEVSLESIETQIAMWKHEQLRRGLADVAHWNLFRSGSPVLVTNFSALPVSEVRLGRHLESPIGFRYTSAFAGLSVVLPSLDDQVRVQCFSQS